MFCCSNFTRARKAKFAVSCYFFSLGCVLGTWAGVLPQIKEDHDLSNSVLGGILVASIFGAILAMPCVSYFTENYGSGFSLFLGGLLLIVLTPIVGVKGHIAVFILGVFFLGFGAGWADMSMNTQAVVCEKMTRTSTLGMFHSIMAIGGLVGALYGGFLLSKGSSVLQITVLLSLLLLFPQLFLSWWLYSPQEEKLIDQNCFINNDSSYEKLENPLLFRNNSEDGSLCEEYLDGADGGRTMADWQEFGGENNHTINYTLLYSVAFLCFLSYFGQGSIGDWSAIYLATDLDSNALECTFGFVGFELLVAVGTYYSDRFVMQFGRKLLLQLSGILAAIGLVFVVVANSIVDHNTALSVAVIGFSISGLGMSVVPPAVISITGSGVIGMKPADAIAYVSSVGYIGILIGPPVLGGIAELTDGLRWSFIVDAVIMLFMSLIAFWYQIGAVRGVVVGGEPGVVAESEKNGHQPVPTSSIE
jgi:MFS family permease